MKNKAKIATTFVLILLFSWFTLDFFFNQKKENPQWKGDGSNSERDFATRLNFKNIIIDTKKESMSGVIHVESVSKYNNVNVEDINLELQNNELLRIPEKNYRHQEISWQELAKEWEIDKSRKPSKEEVVYSKLEMTHIFDLKLEKSRGPTWYPFDKYQAKIDLYACINGQGCGAEPNTDFKSVKIQSDERHFNLVVEEANRDALSLNFTRLRFIKTACILFFFIGCVFFYFLFKSERSHSLLRDSLGYIVAIWAIRVIIVTPDVKTFPTLVDYIIVFTFCTIFSVITIKIIDEQSSCQAKEAGGDS